MPATAEADQKKMGQARATKTTRAEKEVATEDSKGGAGYLPGYVLMGEDQSI